VKARTEQFIEEEEKFSDIKYANKELEILQKHAEETKINDDDEKRRLREELQKYNDIYLEVEKRNKIKVDQRFAEL
jgi:hypothetical protein